MPTASRNTVERTRGARRASASKAHGDEPEEQERAGGGADENGGNPRLVSEADGKAGEHREGQSDGGEVDERRTLVARRDLVAEERGGADFASPAKGIEGEGKGGEEAKDRSERQLAGIDASDGDRHDGGEQRAGNEGDKGANSEARRNTESGDDHDLDQVDRHRESGRRAEALEGGDDIALAVEVARHGVSDANAADDKCGEADERQELGEALDVAFEAGGGVGPRPHPPRRFRKGFFRRLAECFHFGVGRLAGDEDPVAPLDQAAGLDEAGRVRALPRRSSAAARRRSRPIAGQARL